MSSLFSLAPSMAGCDELTLPEFKVEQQFYGKISVNVTKNRNGSAAHALHMGNEHFFARALQTFYHHRAHPLEKLVA